MAKARKAFSRAGVYLILIIASVVSIFPCYFMFVSAFNSTREITNGKLLPGGHFIENLQNLLSGYPIAAGLLNSLKISLIVVVGCLWVRKIQNTCIRKGLHYFSNRHDDPHHLSGDSSL